MVSQAKLDALKKARAVLARDRAITKAYNKEHGIKTKTELKEEEKRDKEIERAKQEQSMKDKIIQKVKKESMKPGEALEIRLKSLSKAREVLKQKREKQEQSRRIEQYKPRTLEKLDDEKFFEKYHKKNKYTPYSYKFPIKANDTVGSLILGTRELYLFNNFAQTVIGAIILDEIAKSKSKKTFTIKMSKVVFDPSIGSNPTFHEESYLTGNVYGFSNQNIKSIISKNMDTRIVEDTENTKPDEAVVLNESITIEDIRGLALISAKSGFSRTKTSSTKLFFYTGFSIYVEEKKKGIEYGLSDKQLEELVMDLEAFEPNSDKLFNDATLYSTNANSKICIYETFWYHYILPDDKKTMKSIKTEKDAMKTLETESKEIQALVRTGKLFDFIKAKSRAETMYVRLFRPKSYVNEDGSTFIPSHGFSMREGVFKNIVNINDFVGKKTFLYDNNHVAPAMMKNAVELKTMKASKFSIDPLPNTKKTKDIISLGYDIETYRKKNGESVVYCICLSNGASFYGKTCVQDFVDYIDKNLLIKTEKTKTHKHTKIDKYHIYGFNNSRFDNLFIWQELKKRDKTVDTLVVGSTIKSIKYGNITFLDLSLYYQGSLATVAENFKLDIHKGIFPYSFAGEETLYYVGEIPEEKHWKSSKDLETYKENENQTSFDMMLFTIKYCVLDAKIAERIALKHLEQAFGEINNKKFDVRTCPTAAGSALKIFQQVFLEETLWESPEGQRKKEREAFKGGRTEVFKKEWKSEKILCEGVQKWKNYLYYVDRNSSYPASMRETMPVEYLRTSAYIKGSDIVPHWLYKVKVVYKGLVPAIVKAGFKPSKYWIPNILVRAESGDIIAAKKTDYTYQWGCEIIEAIKNDCVVDITEVNEYRGSTIFKEFAEYFYYERKKISDTNPSKGEFYKLLMNSLYGKFGQQIKPAWEICSDKQQVDKILSRPKTKLLDYDFIGDYMVVKYTDGRKDERCVGSLVRLSSYITALARTSLSEIMRDVGHENVYYCDTDSIFTSKFPSEDFVDQKELGKWKQEKLKPSGTICNITEAHFLAPKSYIFEVAHPNGPEFDGELVSKAKGHRSKDIETTDFLKAVSGETAVIKNPSMFKRSLSGVSINEQDRSLSTVYNKRIWNGNDSEAFVSLNEWAESKK